MFPIGTIYYRRSFKLVRWIWIFKQNSLETCGFLDNFHFPDNGNLCIAIIILLSWFLLLFCAIMLYKLYVTSCRAGFTCRQALAALRVLVTSIFHFWWKYHIRGGVMQWLSLLQNFIQLSGDSRWWRFLSSVNHTTKTIHCHYHHHHPYCLSCLLL